MQKTKNAANAKDDRKPVDINTVPLLQLVAARDQAIQTVRAIDSELARRDAKG